MLRRLWLWWEILWLGTTAAEKRRLLEQEVSRMGGRVEWDQPVWGGPR